MFINGPTEVDLGGLIWKFGVLNLHDHDHDHDHDHSRPRCSLEIKVMGRFSVGPKDNAQSTGTTYDWRCINALQRFEISRGPILVVMRRPESPHFRIAPVGGRHCACQSWRRSSLGPSSVWLNGCMVVVGGGGVAWMEFSVVPLYSPAPYSILASSSAL